MKSQNNNTPSLKDKLFPVFPSCLTLPDIYVSSSVRRQSSEWGIWVIPAVLRHSEVSLLGWVGNAHFFCQHTYYDQEVC